MTMNRRRFLTISAAMAATPALAMQTTWQGQALGAEVSLTIRGPRDIAEQALTDARGLLADIERMFSLYDPTSDLSRLNARSVLNGPDPRFLDLMSVAQKGYDLTGGLFDPTVQPLWQAHASGGDIEAAQNAVGWNRLQFDQDSIRLGTGQALTFNGIAQGYATDLITERLTALGLDDLLVNIGEFRGVGGPWRLGLHDPTYGDLGMRTLGTGAIATSSPGALSIGTAAHILHPTGTPRWSTVSVEATTAALADCLSTALCLAAPDMINAIARRSDEVKRITVVDWDGNLSTV